MKKLLTVVVAGLSLALPPFARMVFADEPGEPVVLVSDTTDTVVGDGNAVAVVPHAAWTASISGATWIWKSGATASNEVVAFEKSFTVPGNSVATATLDIASDNSYKVFIDSVEVAADPAQNNFQLGTQVTHDLTADVTVGTHTLRIEVKNHGAFNAQSNPAGLLYKFVVKSDCCTDTGDDIVINDNTAIVVNVVGSSANSGDNSSNGGSAGSAGNGGSVIGSDNDDNTGGNGGNSGNGGNGGTVTTGNASAETTIDNLVNYNDVTIDRCGCGCSRCGDDIVINSNHGFVANGAGSATNSGTNNTDGGLSCSSGNGGSVAGSENDG